MKKPKRPKTAWQALLRFRAARESGDPSFGAIVEAIEFLLRREAEKDREERLQQRILDHAGADVGDPYGGGR